MPGAGYDSPPAGYPAEPASPELRRLDELRRSFQPRRFGSGYDRVQVDQLLDQVIVGVSGQGPLGVSDADLDPTRLDLVPGGYFEAEVERALQEAREILRRH
jgi:DivIVA domain-containing protein